MRILPLLAGLGLASVAHAAPLTYAQSLDAGYSAPGLLTATDTEQTGGSLRMPVTQRLSLNAKADQTTRLQGLETSASELDLGLQWNSNWLLSAGVRALMRILFAMARRRRCNPS